MLSMADTPLICKIGKAISGKQSLEHFTGAGNPIMNTDEEEKNFSIWQW